MDAEQVQVEPPFGPPDVPWAAVSSNGDLPEGAIKCGQHDGQEAYVGRARQDGELLIGTAVPSVGICYIAKDGKVTEHKEYEIVTVPVGDPLVWEETTGRSLFRNSLKSGRAKDGEILYAGRHVEGDNTYVGWLHPGEGCIHVSQNGEEKIYETYELLVHKYLDFLCICPPCIPCAPPPE